MDWLLLKMKHWGYRYFWSDSSEESSLGEEGNCFSCSSSSSSDSGNSMSSSDNNILLTGKSSIWSTFIVEEIIQVTTQMYGHMETVIENNTIPKGKRC